jgi:hypothetical protein
MIYLRVDIQPNTPIEGLAGGTVRKHFHAWSSLRDVFRYCV